MIEQMSFLGSVNCSPPKLPAQSFDAPLREYTHRKHSIAKEIGALQKHFLACADHHSAEACRELMVKLAEDRFTLAVVGQFNRGKSTLMNALIGSEVLPIGILPSTSVITVLRFAPQPRLVVQRHDTTWDEEATIVDLPQFVSETENPGNRQRIRRVYVEFPSPILRRGLEFVDTPGIGSSIDANTDTTYNFLPECDAVLFVTSVESPLTSAELQFLHRINPLIRKIFFILNKSDLVSADDSDLVLNFVESVLQRELQSPPRVFVVSSRSGQCAKTSNDPDGWTRSGLAELEAVLAQFLANERSEAFLTAIADKAARLLPPMLTSDKASSSAEVLDACGVADGPPSLRTAGNSDRSSIHEQTSPALKLAAFDGSGDIVSYMNTRGCPLCEYLKKGVFNLLVKWQHAIASDDAAQREFSHNGGFCSLHTWQLNAVASPLGLSIGYAPLVERLSSEMTALARPIEVGRTPMFPSALLTCAVCDWLSRAEIDRVAVFASAFECAPMRNVYNHSQGLCLKHLRLTISRCSPTTSSYLLDDAARRLGELAEDMHSFALKREARRRDLKNSDEEDAYLRALIKIAGDKFLCSPPFGTEA